MHSSSSASLLGDFSFSSSCIASKIGFSASEAETGNGSDFSVSASIFISEVTSIKGVTSSLDDSSGIDSVSIFDGTEVSSLDPPPMATSIFSSSSS